MIVNTSNFQNAERFISELISKNGMGAIIGEKGSGKTFIKRHVIGAFEEKKGKYSVIEVTPMVEDSRNITSIMSALILELSGESPRKDIEARRRQLRRILGDAEMNGRIVILAIDEAQDLHKSTLRGLKKLHELGYGRKDRLFTTILFGQPGLVNKISDNELGPRIKRLNLKGLNTAEKRRFIEFPDLFSEKALKIFAHSVYGTPLSIIHSFNELNEMRLKMEYKKIDERIVNNYLLEELNYKIFGLKSSIRELSKDIEDTIGKKLSPTLLCQVKNRNYEGNLANIKTVFDDYLNKKGISVTN